MSTNAESHLQPPIEYRKKNSLASATLIAIGSLTGAGIYVLLGPATRLTGSGVILSFGIDIVISLFIAGAYAECSSKFPKNGGGFVFIIEAFGTKGLIIGWVVWLSNIAYGALCAYGFGQFLSQIFGFDSYPFLIFTSIGGVVLFTFINTRGSTGLAKAQNPLIIALLGTFMIGGVYLFLHPTGTPNIPSITGFFPATALMLNVFVGFENVVSISEEVKNPRKNVPRALILSILVSAIFYFVIITGVVLTQDANLIANSDLAFLDAVRADPIIYYIVFLGAILALLTSLGVALMAASRNLSGLAKFDFIDRKWGEIHPKHQAPNRALFLTAAIMIIILLSNQAVYIASISLVAFMFSVVFVALSAIKLQRIKNSEADTFRMPFTPVTHYLTIGASLFLMIFIELDSIYLMFVWFIIGLVIYLFFSSKKRIYGTIYLIITFFVTIYSIMFGVLLILFGLVYYLFSIADRSTVKLTLAGVKIITTAFLVGIAYYIVENEVLPEISNEISITLTIIALVPIISTVFDLIPMQELMSIFIKKHYKSSVPIQIGQKVVMVLGKRGSRFLFYFNYLGGIMQIATACLLFSLWVWIITGISIAIEIVWDFILKAVIGITALCLFFSGILWIHSGKDLKKID